MSIVSNLWAEGHHQSYRAGGMRFDQRSQRIFKLTAGTVGLMISSIVVAAPVNIVLPTQPLADALVQFAKKTGTSVVVDSALVAGKKAPALDGYWEPQEGIRRLLAGSGLYAVLEGDTILIRKGESAKKNELVTDTVNVRASRFQQIGPLPGLSLSKEEIPGNVQSLSAKEIKDSHASSMAELMNSQLQSVNVNDYQGNPFQMDITYRGFTASPQIGTPQGLSVFMDGIRVNEPFGDIVNWDMIPMSALAGLDVFPGSNPIFGLNTLGGAIAVRTKNGFDNPGTDVEVLTGAFGRSQATLSTGGSKGDVAWYFSANKFKESGWRNNSPSEVNQVFGKLSYRNDVFNIDGSMLYASNNLIGNGLIPIEMYKEDSSSVFTSPDQTQNRLLQFQVAGAFQVNDTFSITGQTYNRKSDRTSVTGDINRNFAEYSGKATRRPAAGETPVCAYASTNAYGIPDYYLFNESALGAGASEFEDFLLFGFYNSINDYAATLPTPTINPVLPTPDAIAQANLNAMLAAARGIEANMFHGGPNTSTYSYLPGDVLSGPDSNFDGQADWSYGGYGGGYYEDSTGVRRYIVSAAALNGVADAFDPSLLPYTSQCGQNGIDTTNSYLDLNTGQLLVGSASSGGIRRNGAFYNTGVPSQAGTGTGYIDGTPTSIITRTQINQITKGGSVQFNFDLEQHKFMMGASLDRSTDTYTSSQMLGLLTANRSAYLAPDQIGAEFSAAQVGVSTNDFSGNSDTRSVYFSDTFNPSDTLHFSFSSRYNYTKVSSTIAARHRNATIDLMDYQSGYMAYLLCGGSTLASCDQNLLNNPVLDYRLLNGALLDPPETEAFTYHKLNPAFGVSWSPKNNINVYANWNQGTRAPSAVELGCAYDGTIVTVSTTSGSVTGPRSLVSGHNCALPTALSGDPYLPQVVARTTELGARGKLANGWDWNASVYNTKLTDDIYFVAFTSTQSFFDTVGNTRRRGIEFGLSGKEDKWDFKFNYALTDATFESTAVIANADNSSVNHNVNAGTARDMMTISPGNRIPGIPLHNINLNVGYQVTEKWRIGLTMVAHSESYARGNENNQHHAAVLPYVVNNGVGGTMTISRNYTGDGKTPGYAVFNLNTSYDFGGGWIANLSVINLLDKEYFSASRLDINPFVTGQYGVTDASGFNFNSRDWNSTTFVGPGAPRAAWFTLKYDFDADRR